MTKSKKLACAACDLLIELSRGTLNRAITKADKDTNDVCVSAVIIKRLFNALESAHPGLYDKAKALLEKQDASAKPARDAQYLAYLEKRKREVEEHNLRLKPKGRFKAFQWIPFEEPKQ